MEPEFIDEERIPLLERDENIGDDSIYEDSQAETSFFQEDIIQQEATEAELRLRERSIEKKDVADQRFSARLQRLEYQLRNEVRFRRSSGYLQIEKSPG